MIWDVTPSYSHDRTVEHDGEQSWGTILPNTTAPNVDINTLLLAASLIDSVALPALSQRQWSLHSRSLQSFQLRRFSRVPLELVLDPQYGPEVM